MKISGWGEGKQVQNGALTLWDFLWGSNSPSTIFEHFIILSWKMVFIWNDAEGIWQRVREKIMGSVWVELVPPKRFIRVLVTSICECDLIWIRVFAGVTKLRWVHTHLGWVPIQPKGCPSKKRSLGHRCTQRRTDHVRTEAEIKALVTQTKDSRNHEKLEEAKDSSPVAFKASVALLTPWLGASGHSRTVRIHICCLKPPSLKDFVIAAAGSEYGYK